MGYGKKLKEILNEKNMTVKELAQKCDMAPTTLYSIINKDTNIRFDFALRIANVLDIPIETICDDIPYDAASTLPNLLTPGKGFIPKNFNANKNYVKYRTMPILELYDNTDLPGIDRLLAAYFILDNEARLEALKYLDLKAETHTDAERKKKLKSIKK